MATRSTTGTDKPGSTSGPRTPSAPTVSPPPLGDAGKSDSDKGGMGTLTLPRWVVYCQGAMLGVVAISFFVFGLMVGNLTSGLKNGRTETTVSGLVTFKQGSDSLPDEDAVVLILPTDKRPDERSKAVDMHPHSFEPLENSGIDRVHALGGAIVRVGKDGRFRVIVDGPQKYNVIVVSNHTTSNSDEDESSDGDQLTKAQRASVADYFFPVDKAIGDQRVHWTTFEASGDTYELREIQFD